MQGPRTVDELLATRAARWVGIVAAAFVAACLAILALNLTTPPRELAQLLPTPTPTRRPPPTITPVAYPPTPPMVLRDTFAGKDNFPRASGVKLGYEYADKAFQLSPPPSPGLVRVLNQTFNDAEYRNLSLDARAAPLPDSKPIEYGVLFWHSEDDEGRERFLAFTVSTDATFRLLAYEPVTDTAASNIYRITEVVPKTPSSDIFLDGKPNHLRVDVHPRRLLAYINDALVIDTDAKIINELRLARGFDGRVGLIALAKQEGATANFTQFDIYADGKTPPSSE